MNQQAPINNYKINFYNNVEMVNDYYAQYLNMLSKAVTNNSIEEEEAVSIEGLKENIKFLIHKLHLQSMTIAKGVDKKTKDLYLKIRTSPVPEEDDLEAYILHINTFLMEKVGDVEFGESVGQMFQ